MSQSEAYKLAITIIVVWILFWCVVVWMRIGPDEIGVRVLIYLAMLAPLLLVSYVALGIDIIRLRRLRRWREKRGGQPTLPSSSAIIFAVREDTVKNGVLDDTDLGFHIILTVGFTAYAALAVGLYFFHCPC